MARHDNFTISEFHCTICGGKGMPIPRKMSKQREAGHLKKLHCLYCKRETNHMEYRSFEHSKEEFMEILREEMEKNAGLNKSEI